MARTRSVEAHKKVIDAAVSLFADRGIDATSMDAIAEHSGVSKATIYKHWPDKDALALEVLAHIHGLNQQRPSFHTADYRRDLIDLLSYRPGTDQAVKEKIWPHLMAYSAHNQAFGDAWRARVSGPAHRSLVAMIQRGQKEGILRKRIDYETGVAMLLGPFMYRHIFARHFGAKGPKDLELHVADAFLAAFGVKKK
jgi:AcrR family transcriptional regulator